MHNVQTHNVEIQKLSSLQSAASLRENDLDSEWITFYRVLWNHLKWVLSSREWFQDWERRQGAGLVTDKTYAAPVFSLARIMGRTSDQAARFLILLLALVLEPLSIGLAVATSAVWQKPAEKLVGKRPETNTTVKTVNSVKSNS